MSPHVDTFRCLPWPLSAPPDPQHLTIAPPLLWGCAPRILDIGVLWSKSWPGRLLGHCPSQRSPAATQQTGPLCVQLLGRTSNAIRQIGVSEQTCYHWRNECGGPDVSQARPLKEPDQENRRLKRILRGRRRGCS